MGFQRGVTRATIWTWPRADDTITWSPFLIPFSSASSLLISTNGSGWASASQGRVRDIAPACQCSQTRYVVQMMGDLSAVPTAAPISLSLSVLQILIAGSFWTLDIGLVMGDSSGS